LATKDVLEFEMEILDNKATGKESIKITQNPLFTHYLRNRRGVIYVAIE